MVVLSVAIIVRHIVPAFFAKCAPDVMILTLFVVLSFYGGILSFTQPMAMVWFNAEAILLSLKQDPEVARRAALYLKWETIGLPAYTFNHVAR